jgi:hypothetical protein
LDEQRAEPPRLRCMCRRRRRRRAQVHYILDEMLLNGCIVDTNKQNILEPVQLLEQAT